MGSTSQRTVPPMTWAGVLLLASFAARSQEPPPAFTTLGEQGPVLASRQLSEQLLNRDSEPARALLDGQLRFARELARTSAEEVLPILGMYQVAFRDLLERGDERNAFRVRANLTQLLEIAEASAASFEAQTAVARQLELLAVSFLDRQQDLVGIKLLERGARLDPGSVSILLHLARAEERRGKPLRALRYLEQVAALDATPREAQLRLGVQLVRMPDLTRAIEVLRPLAGATPDDWIRQLAYHELARALVDTADDRAALEVLEEGRTRFPADCTLATALLWVRERAGQPSAEEPSCSRTTGTSARMRYAERPASALDTASLARGLERFLPALQRALARGAP